MKILNWYNSLLVALFAFPLFGSDQSKKSIQNRFFEAVESCQFQEADRLLALGAKVDGKVKFFTRVIHNLSNNKPVHTTIYKRKKPFLVSFYVIMDQSNIRPVNYLLSRGADPNSLYNEPKIERLPLIFYALFYYHSYWKIQLLIEYGANLTSRDSDGNTALHVAVERDNAELVKLLLNPPARKKPVIIVSQEQEDRNCCLVQ